MHVFRDSASIRGAGTQIPEVAPFIAKRIEELSEYADYELGDLVHVFVAQPGDSLAHVEAALGFRLYERFADALDVHPSWFELAWVLADDGSGLVLYVPDRPDMDPQLLAACERQAARGQQ